MRTEINYEFLDHVMRSEEVQTLCNEVAAEIRMTAEGMAHHPYTSVASKTEKRGRAVVFPRGRHAILSENFHNHLIKAVEGG